MRQGYRLGIGLIVAVLFAVQHAVQLLLSGSRRTFLGDVVSLAFVAAVAEFSTMALGRRIARRPAGTDERVSTATVFAIATVLLVLDLFAKVLSPYLATQRQPPPTIPLLVVVGLWLAVIGIAARRPRDAERWCMIGLIGLIFGTRVLVLWVSPFDRLTGDMLPVIDRGLGDLFAGRFPYLNYPPPMPYLSGMFLAYVPPKLLNIDIRITNLILDVIAAFVVMRFSPRPAGREGTGERGFALDQLALPFFMLHPPWIYYSVNTQFSPCLFATALLGRAITTAGPRLQALTLGFAVGSNQMLVALGPILFGYWLANHGWRRAFALSALAAGVFLAMIAPFLLWNPWQFVNVAFMSRGEFSDALMSGRFTILPPLRRLIPFASPILSIFAMGIAAFAATRGRRPESVVAAMAIGLCAVLLVQPVSFSHYFLPVIVLAAIATGDSGTNP